MRYCTGCDNTRLVCEAHPDRPCPISNKADEDTEPELPEGFVVDKRSGIKDWN
jgi:hypothetical protein